MTRTAPMFDGPLGTIIPIIGIIILIVMHLRRSKIKPLTGTEVAQKLGLSFDPAESTSILSRYAFINRMQYGKKKHAYNALKGCYQEEQVELFDLRYEIYGIDKNSTDDYYSFYTLKLPRSFPEVTLYKEGLISKLYQATGHNDIDFESHEFSRKFRVRSDNPKFAYDFCNARMIEYLIDNTDLSIEIDRNILCISFNKPLQFEAVEHNLGRLLMLRSLMPDYLFSK